jgi:hypothetical protein
VSHNYPNIVLACWGQVSTIVYGFLTVPTPEVYSRPWKGHTGDIVGFIGEKVITAAVKVECLFPSLTHSKIYQIKQKKSLFVGLVVKYICLAKEKGQIQLI